MSPSLEQILHEKYPALFADKDKPPTESLMCFGCECEDGWFGIIEAMCRTLSSYTESYGANFKFIQIKEKFGGLRVYSSGGDGYCDGVVDMAESISYRTCEKCGDQGSKYHRGLKTLCERHAEELGYSKKDDEA
jgi:hypothetical protein